jgi:hypothetical protein
MGHACVVHVDTEGAPCLACLQGTDEDCAVHASIPICFFHSFGTQCGVVLGVARCPGPVARLLLHSEGLRPGEVPT